MAEAVSTRCSNRETGSADQRKRHRMRRDAHRHRRPTGCHRQGDVWSTWEHQRQRSGPEARSQRLDQRRNLSDDVRQRLHSRQVNDQGIVSGATLRYEDTLYSFGIQSVGP